MTLDQVIKKNMGNLLSLQRIAAKKLQGGVVAKTPKDTGSAQESWTPSLNEIKAVNVDVGMGDMHRNPIEPVVNNMQLGDTFYIANGLPYIRPLEYGHSPQSSHMVSRTKAEWSMIVSSAIREVKSGS